MMREKSMMPDEVAKASAEATAMQMPGY